MYWGYIRDNGKESGNYYLGLRFRVNRQDPMMMILQEECDQFCKFLRSAREPSVAFSISKNYALLVRDVFSPQYGYKLGYKMYRLSGPPTQ